MNHDFGIYAQDSWTLKRLTLNVGLRYEKLNAQVLEGTSPAGRFIGERNFAEVTNLPDWSDIAPRFAAVYDLFGNAKTALKYSLNRYNLARTTGIADQYNPLAATQREPAVDGPQRQQRRRGRPSAACTRRQAARSTSRSSPATSGPSSLNTYGDYPRTWNLEHGLELQHELLPRLSVTGSWFHGNFANLTTTINRALQVAGQSRGQPVLHRVPGVQPDHRRTHHRVWAEVHRDAGAAADRQPGYVR